MKSLFNIKYQTCYGLFILIAIIFFSAYPVCSEVIERVVAVVNNEVILLSDFRHEMIKGQYLDDTAGRRRVLDRMIDRLLLLEQAKKMRLDRITSYRGVVDDDKLIDEYLRKRVSALINVPFEQVESWYIANMDKFGNKKLIEVKGEIEAELIKSEFKIKVQAHIIELRRRAYIRIQLQGHE
jgi:hypothetical protein